MPGFCGKKQIVSLRLRFAIFYDILTLQTESPNQKRLDDWIFPAIRAAFAVFKAPYLKKERRSAYENHKFPRQNSHAIDGNNGEKRTVKEC